MSATDGGSELPQEKILTNVKDGPRGGIDDYERDTASKEDMSEEELFKLLLPDGKFPLPGASEKSRFFLAVYCIWRLGCCRSSRWNTRWL